MLFFFQTFKIYLVIGFHAGKPVTAENILKQMNTLADYMEKVLTASEKIDVHSSVAGSSKGEAKGQRGRGRGKK